MAKLCPFSYRTYAKDKLAVVRKLKVKEREVNRESNTWAC